MFGSTLLTTTNKNSIIDLSCVSSTLALGVFYRDNSRTPDIFLSPHCRRRRRSCSAKTKSRMENLRILG